MFQNHKSSGFRPVRLEWAALLNGSKYRPPNGLRKFDWREESSRVEIVFARFIYYTNVPIALSRGVRASNVYFAALQIVAIRIVDA